MMNSRFWGKIAVLVAVCGWTLSAQAKYDGGSGTETEPFRISAVSDWQELMTTPADWASHFVLTGDLDLDGVLLSPVGSDTNKFTGVFDGNDYVIRNADVNAPHRNYVGLFGCLGTDGQIKNLGVEDISAIGRYWVGGLVGWNYWGIVSNCYSTGTISGGENVGGLVGENWCGTIGNCYSLGRVSGDENIGGLVGYNSLASGAIINSYSTGSAAGDRYVGGLAGTNGGTLSNCYSTASVGGNYFVGGLVGWNYQGAIGNCYSSGTVGGTGASVGGLVGSKYAGTVSSSFWDVDTSGWMTSAAGTPKTTAEMMTKSTFTDASWDFVGETVNGTEDIWAICEGTNYPRFVYQIPRGDIVCPDGVNSLDFAVLARYWHEADCAALNDCNGADIDLSGGVDFGDFGALAESWLTGL